MGIIRGGLLSIVVVLLFLSLLAGGLLLTLSMSLSYANVKPQLSSVIKGAIEKELVTQEDRSEKFNSIARSCEDKSEAVLTEQGFTLTIPCNLVSQGLDSIIDYSADSLVEQIYYGSYDCGFWNCFVVTGQPFFLVSEKAKDYWTVRFYIALTIFVVLAVLAFLLIGRKTSFPILLGILAIISGLPLLKTDLISSLFGDAFYGVFGVFFSRAVDVAWIMIIPGVILILLGIALKIGFHDWVKKKFSKQEVKEIVKEEVAKAKKQEKPVVVKPVAKPIEKPEVTKPVEKLEKKSEVKKPIKRKEKKPKTASISILI